MGSFDHPRKASRIAGLIGHEARRAIDISHTLAQDAGLSDRPAQALAEWEEHVRSSIEQAKKDRPREVWVLEPKALPKYIENAPAVLSSEDVAMAAYHLSRYVRGENR